MEQKSCHFAGFFTETRSSNNLGHPNALRNIVTCTKVHNLNNNPLTWPFKNTSVYSLDSFKISELRCCLKKTPMDTMDLHTF